MYSYVKNYIKENEYIEIYETETIRNFYEDFANNFSLETSFDIVNNWYGDDIVCSVYSKKLWKSVIINWNCKRYTHLIEDFDIIADYLVNLEIQWRWILNILEDLK